MSDQSQPRRTQAQRTRQRKEQVIREAIRLFGQNGYHGARLADIAAAAGVTEPGLLHHFPSKAHLLMEVLAERDRIDHERFDLAPSESASAPLQSLEKLTEYNETVPGLVQLFTVLVAESIDEGHPAHSFFQQRYQNLREQSVAFLEAAQARGEIRQDIPARDLAVMVFAMMDGLQVQWLYEPDRVNMASLYQQFMKLIRTHESGLNQNEKEIG